MPPRRRKDSDPGPGDPAYDGVPTVNVELDEEPQAMTGAVTPAEVPVVQVPALEADQADAPQPSDED
jgi:hypothetical protein